MQPGGCAQRLAEQRRGAQWERAEPPQHAQTEGCEGLAPFKCLTFQYFSCRKACPLWLRWPRFWLVTFAIIALIMLNAQNIHSADTAKQQSSREALEEVAKTFALATWTSS